MDCNFTRAEDGELRLCGEVAEWLLSVSVLDNTAPFTITACTAHKDSFVEATRAQHEGVALVVVEPVSH